MSTYFYLACGTCQQELRDAGDTRSEEVLNQIIAVRQACEQIAMAAHWAQLRIDSVIVDLGFMLEHKGHALVARCEYESINDAVKRQIAGLSWWQWQERQPR